MIGRKIFLGKSALVQPSGTVQGEYVLLDDERFYRIANFDTMNPFFMSIVSDSDHWMFISSLGGLTAGRKNADNALFPYYTDDRIHDAQDQTGSKTILIVEKEGKSWLWEPFSDRYAGLYDIQRNLYKNIPGNKILFEEINRTLETTFQYAWLNSERFGFVKQSSVSNIGEEAIAVDVLDGIQNVLPYGITRRFQLEYSTLADGYKRNELDAETGLGLFRMSSIPTDKAEPSEALKVTTVWSEGLKGAVRLLSAGQLVPFRLGRPLTEETDIKGKRGGYFLNAHIELETGSKSRWHIVADINKDHSQVADLRQMLKAAIGLEQQIADDVARGTQNLERIVANADGLQLTGDELSANRHFSNVLFNEMRGGIFDQDYKIDRADFLKFIKITNRLVAERQMVRLEVLPEQISLHKLLDEAAGADDAVFEKLCYEYLPLTFGRRHGDPSRPWNLFSINIKDEHGEKILDYQGNWRDIFQNWEALAASFPAYLESMISKFVNATTADGYNPYRVVRDGFDWEVLDPNDAWSYIGYWGDHQIIYLLKLLEASSKYSPGRLTGLLGKEIFGFANVPYRLKPYEELLADPQNTILFDHELDAKIQDLVSRIGEDGKFIQDGEEGPYLVNLTEKLLISVLAKIANFIPEAGIWMNTQRPEWNDANNALVGSGVSMVTLYYLRRFMLFFNRLFEASDQTEKNISSEVADWLGSTVKIFVRFGTLLSAPLSDSDRKQIMDALGQAGSDYRLRIYDFGFSGEKTTVSIESLRAFSEWSIQYIDHTIEANRRNDHLYHAYNLFKVNQEGIEIRHLYEMLEGQVAVLSSGKLSPTQSLELLDALRQSALYREDQNSYILYPERDLPRFLEKNVIPEDALKTSKLLQKLILENNRQVILKDSEGQIHFRGEFNNARALKAVLDSMADSEYVSLIEAEQEDILKLYEKIFDHQSFTGRSGTFYKYEGLGSIYWHMVSKLLLAVQEVMVRARENGEKQSVLKRLQVHYNQIRDGIGVHKSPELYGAFPTDPYSHTPGFSGVQQPGMTGQVKEDILTRFGELGLQVKEGEIHFTRDYLPAEEFLSETGRFVYFDLSGEKIEIDLEPRSLAFTCCQVPVVYTIADSETIQLILKDGSQKNIEKLNLDTKTSASIFNREDRIRRIDVRFKR